MKKCKCVVWRKYRLIGKIKVVLSLLLIAFNTWGISAGAQESSVVNRDCEIILMLDASQSMEELDKQYSSFDFIKGLAASLPSHCRMGMVVYQEKVIKSVPLGSSYSAIEEELGGLTYKQYGDAGAALMEACTLLSEEEGEKRIVWITDGELLLASEEKIKESTVNYQQALEKILDGGIVVDILALGERKTEGETVYSAAELSGGRLEEFSTGEELDLWLKNYLLSVLNLNVRQVGSLAGNDGELTITLPDTSMKKTKILLLGSGIGENLTVSAEANRLELHKGICFAAIDLLEPNHSTIALRTESEGGEMMDLEAYLFSEYSYLLAADLFFQADTGLTELEIALVNGQGNSLLDEDYAKGIEIISNGEKKNYQVKEGKAWWEQAYEESTEVTIEVNFPVSGSYYYGNNTVTEEILIPEPEKPQIDWLFWGILILFLIANGGILSLAVKKRRQQRIKPRGIADKGLSLVEKESGKTTFYGKLVVYVIQNKEEIDYPPASINLFARCNRSVITLEWLLDTCSLPLSLKGADQVIFKPGKEKNLIVQNKGKASALKGKELLLKGKAYPVYYHEKITFLFEEEGAEIEVHYKDLKPNER